MVEMVNVVRVVGVKSLEGQRRSRGRPRWSKGIVGGPCRREGAAYIVRRKKLS